MKYLLLTFFALWLIPTALSAAITIKAESQHEATWKKFNDVVEDKIKEAKGVFFGPILKLCGFLGICVGVFYLIKGDKRVMLTAIGIGIFLSILPTFIETVFSAMLPGM